jgi:hypothetical protein
VIRENLNARTDDENHEEQIEKVLQSKPQWKARMHCSRRGRDAWVTRKKFLHSGNGTQLLRDGDPNNQNNKRKRHDPQDIDPSPPDTDVGHDAFARRQPPAQTEAIVRTPEAHLKRIT